VNSQVRKPLEYVVNPPEPCKGETFLLDCLSPLRGFAFPLFELQGLAPLAIDCRPYRGSPNRCEVSYAIRDGQP